MTIGLRDSFGKTTVGTTPTTQHSSLGHDITPLGCIPFCIRNFSTPSSKRPVQCSIVIHHDTRVLNKPCHVLFTFLKRVTFWNIPLTKIYDILFSALKTLLVCFPCVVAIAPNINKNTTDNPPPNTGMRKIQPTPLPGY